MSIFSFDYGISRGFSYLFETCYSSLNFSNCNSFTSSITIQSAKSTLFSENEPYFDYILIEYLLKFKIFLGPSSNINAYNSS